MKKGNLEPVQSVTFANYGLKTNEYGVQCMGQGGSRGRGGISYRGNQGGSMG